MPQTKEDWRMWRYTYSFARMLLTLEKFSAVIHGDYTHFKDYSRVCSLGLRHDIVPDDERELVTEEMEKFKRYSAKLPDGVDMIEEIHDAPSGKRENDIGYYTPYEVFMGPSNSKSVLFMIFDTGFDTLYKNIDTMFKDGADINDIETQFKQLRTFAKSTIYKYRIDIDKTGMITTRSQNGNEMKDALKMLKKLNDIQSRLDQIKAERREARQAIIHLRTVATRTRTATGERLELPDEIERLIDRLLRYKGDAKPAPKARSSKSRSSPHSKKPLSK